MASMRNAGRSRAEIATAMNVDIEVVDDRLAALEYIKTRDIDDLARKYKAGRTISDLAEDRGESRECIRTKLLKAGVTMRKRGRRSNASRMHLIDTESSDHSRWIVKPWR